LILTQDNIFSQPYAISVSAIFLFPYPIGFSPLGGKPGASSLLVNISFSENLVGRVGLEPTAT
jgi:hypothetical protein